MIIDTHVHPGKIARYEYTNYTIDHFISIWDRIGVSMGCLSSSRALFATPSEGNDETLDAFRRFPQRVIPLVSLNPLFGVQKTMAEMVRRHHQGFRGVKLLPGENRYSLEVVKPIIQKAVEYSWPVLIHSPNLVILEKILGDYPQARILIGHCWGVDEGRARLAKRFPNVVVEISGMGRDGPGVFERFVELCGAENIVFGSDLPCVYVGHTLKVVESSSISTEEKDLILWKNAAKLFEIARNKIPVVGNRERWEGEIIDVCCRCGFDSRTGAKALGNEFDQAVKKYSITKSLVHSIEGITYDFVSGNQATLKFCEGRPAEPLCLVNPGFLTAALDEIRNAKARGFRAIVIGPINEAWFDESAVRAVIVETAHSGLPLLIEITEPAGGSLPVTIDALLPLAKQYPETSFVLLGLPGRWWPLLQTARDIGNVYFGTAPLFFSDSIKKAVDLVGAKRIVFESVFPYHDPGNGLGCIEESDITIEDKEDILSGNAKRMFNLK